jgi:DNA-binding transcriptional regulator GbsR (MarR family)
MIDTQARIISNLNECVAKLKSQVHDLEKQQYADKNMAAMYRDIIAMVKANPALQSIWDELIVTMRMIDPGKFK